MNQLTRLPCGCSYSEEEYGKPSRFWFYKPELYWYGWKTLLPFGKGSDEWCRFTIVIGWNFTGQIIIPYRQCRGCEDCGRWVNGKYFLEED